jgi:hypothetical protein
LPPGVTLSETGRIFICFPKWGDDVKFTVAEIVDDELQPYPNLETNLVNPENIKDSFISVQSVVSPVTKESFFPQTERNVNTTSLPEISSQHFVCK